LGEAETKSEMRTVLFGMALGWLRLAVHNGSSHAVQLEIENHEPVKEPALEPA
jgi:hypothetical protein